MLYHNFLFLIERTPSYYFVRKLPIQDQRSIMFKKRLNTILPWFLNIHFTSIPFDEYLKLHWLLENVINIMFAKALRSLWISRCNFNWFERSACDQQRNLGRPLFFGINLLTLLLFLLPLLKSQKGLL